MIQDGALAEWLGNGLQNRVHGFESRRCLHICLRADGGIGRHERLKISWPQGRAGSSPALRTKIDEDSTCFSSSFLIGNGIMRAQQTEHF